MNNSDYFHVIKTQDTGQWYKEKGKWLHQSKRFFSLIENYDRFGPILEQNEIGCLGLLIFEDEKTGEREFLIQKKTEPGSSLEFEYSTTIQATRSNFERAHNGASVPLFDEFISQAKLLHCSIQIEQTDAYLEKANANIIKTLPKNLYKYSKHHVNVSEAELFRLFKDKPTLFSMDLRSLLSIYFSINYLDTWNNLPQLDDLNNYDLFLQGHTIAEVKKRSVNLIDPSIVMSITKYKNRDEDTRYNYNFYDICIRSRENTSWIQPLLVRQNKVKYQLMIDESGKETALSLCLGTTEKNNWLLFCPNKTEESCLLGTTSIEATFCEEGGRFFRVRNSYSLITRKFPSKNFSIALALFCKDYLLPGMHTSIELRSLLFLFFMSRRFS